MPKKMIIAEDDEYLRGSYVEFFRILKKDLEVEAVPNGEELLERMGNSRYDLVMTDNDLGRGINGFEVIARIREFDKAIPIFMVSGTEGLVEKFAIEQGATGYLVKKYLSLGKIREEIIDKYLS